MGFSGLAVNSGLLWELTKDVCTLYDLISLETVWKDLIIPVRSDLQP
jgi:hypothetical protein